MGLCKRTLNSFFNADCAIEDNGNERVSDTQNQVSASSHREGQAFPDSFFPGDGDSDRDVVHMSHCPISKYNVIEVVSGGNDRK